MKFETNKKLLILLLIKLLNMLSQKSKYALKALGFLAKNHGRGPVLMSVIAREKKIPLRFLENIFHELKNTGFLNSHRGRFGGYTLVNEPSQTKVSSVIRVVNGPLAMLPCVSLNFYATCDDCCEATCGLRGVFQEARDALLKVLENRYLSDIMDLDELI